MTSDARAARATATSRGYAAGLGGVFVWSWTAILIGYLLRSRPMAPMALAFWRDLTSAGAMLAVLAVFRPATVRVARRDFGFLLLYGASLALLNVTWTWSIAWNGAAVSTVLVYSSPAITALAARLLFGERLGPTRAMALAASIAGCVLVAKANDPARWNLNAPGIVAGLLSAVSFALYSMMGKVASRRGVDPWTATLYTFAGAALALLPIAYLTPWAGGQNPLLSLGAQWDVWLLLLLLVVPTLGGYGLYTVSLAYLPVATANIIATLEPVLTTIWAHLLLGESLDAPQSVGGALIIGSVAFLQLDARGRAAAVDDAAVPVPPAET
jgi:drug/metabolite transporter (DMT)-like permease